MKATDLMIGDWVSCDGKNYQIAEIAGMVVIDAENELFASLEDIQPVPLTPEILEKNGFYYGNTASEEDFCNAVGCSYPEEGWCYDEGAGEIKILFPTESDGGLIRLDDQNADKHLELVFVEPIMLHELQHALKLCGIDKEITL